MTVEQRIECLIIAWLEAEQGIKATRARIDEDDWSIRRGYSDGCETCGWGSDPDYLELTIWYAEAGEHGFGHYVEVQKDPLNFLVELLKLEDETK